MRVNVIKAIKIQPNIHKNSKNFTKNTIEHYHLQLTADSLHHQKRILTFI